MRIRLGCIIGWSLLTEGLAHRSEGQYVKRVEPAAASNPIGVWRGTSLCSVRPSPCNDEIVVYRIMRVKAGDSLSLDGRKIVSGQEVQMGVLGCRLAASGAQFTCTMPNGVWHFTIRGDSLVGELRLPDNTKYRDISTARSR